MKMPEIKIVNLSRPMFKLPTILIDRTTWLGNPYHIGTDGSRTEVIEKYKVWFDTQMLNDPEFKVKFFALAESYKRYEIIQLACHCSPKLCHGSIIKQALEEIYREL